jgi:hypothetical protein
MTLAAHSLTVIERVERRILGAFRLLDAVTRLPVLQPVEVRALGAVLVRPGGDIEVPLPRKSVEIRQNRSGFHVLFRAPLFDEYTATFLDPQPPPDTQAGPLRLRLAIDDAGPQYLPRQFTFDLPRATDPNAVDSVFDPVPVDLFRSPAAPVQDGWALLRVRIVEEGSDPETPLPRVLVRVFRSPRGAQAPAIGVGMTEWRGGVRGEALVPVTGVPRFRPGPGNNVIETELPVLLEAARAVTGAADQLPDPSRILAAIPQGLGAPAPAGFVVLRPAQPVNVRAGQELSVQLSMS